jgi:hypothetical protein
MRTGLFCEVYRAKGFEKCAMGGISEKHDTVLLVGDGVSGPFSEDEAKRLGHPVVVLVRRAHLGRGGPDGVTRSMAGGAFIKSSDSRFPCDYPLSLHDRVES